MFMWKYQDGDLEVKMYKSAPLKQGKYDKIR